MLVRRGVLLLVPLIAASSPAVERPLVLMVGDSTTQGVCAGCPPPPSASPARALGLLRHRLPPGSRWRHLRACSAGVGGSTSGDWVRVRPAICAFAGQGARAGEDFGTRVLRRACARGDGLAAAARELAGEPALVLVTLGANDVMNRVPAEEYLANLRVIVRTFAPAPVLVATPFWSPQAQRTALADLAVALRRTELAHGPDFYAIRLPVDASGVHLTPGGYAAAAALWLDLLPP